MKLALILFAGVVVQVAAEVGHGWHTDVEWKSLEDGKTEAAARFVLYLAQ